MDVTVLRPDELTAADIDSWHAMQCADLALASPFMSPEFARVVGHQRATARVARLTRGSRTVGFFPFERHALGFGKPIGSGFCDCQGLIHEPGLGWDPMELLRACGLATWEYDHLAAGQIPFETEGTHLAKATSPIIELNSEAQTYVERLRHSFVKALRRKERKLGREVGPLRLVFEEADPKLLDTLIRWKSAQLRAKGHLDMLSKVWFLTILRELFGLPSEFCSGIVSVLYAGEEPVAMRYQLLSRRVLASWFPVYHSRFSRYSPGILLCLKLAETAGTRGIAYIDLGKGTEHYKTDLKTAELSLSEGYVERHTAKAALCRLRMASDSAVHAAVRANPTLHRAAARAANVAERLR
ncbi:GNAT family N-acetyltransferase [Streptomyces sp. NPDC001604]|uniref:GNAT family N-acetyltransferase n=1 Tax=Streptomyces sp. NPDC001604 TaxID=3364593 RepID=UPI00367FFFDA